MIIFSSWGLVFPLIFYPFAGGLLIVIFQFEHEGSDFFSDTRYLLANWHQKVEVYSHTQEQLGTPDQMRTSHCH